MVMVSLYISICYSRGGPESIRHPVILDREMFMSWI